MAVSEETKLANLNRLKATIEEFEKNPSLDLVFELKALSTKRYPVTDEWILWHFEKGSLSFLSDSIRKEQTRFTIRLLKDVIDEIHYKKLNNFSCTHLINHIKWMITENSLRAPRCGERGLMWDEIKGLLSKYS
jgi:hypothetical protein